MKRLFGAIFISFLYLNAYGADRIYRVMGLSGDVLDNTQKRLDAYIKQLPQPLNQHSLMTFRKNAPENILKAIQPYGYYKPKITSGLSRETFKPQLKSWQTWIKKQHSFKQIIFYVIPGPQMKVTSLKIQISGPGKSNPNILSVVKNAPLKQGEPLLIENYNETKQQLFDAAEHAGYLKAVMSQSEVTIDLKKYTANVQLHLNTGIRYYFGKVTYSPILLSPQLLNRYIPFKAGAPYSTDEILHFNELLSGSGYFKRVTVNPDLNSNQFVPIDVHLVPRARRSYSFGLGFGTDTGPRGKAGISFIPVNAKGDKFYAFAQGSFKQNQLQTQYVIPGAQPDVDQTSLGARLFNLDYTSGHSSALQASIARIHNNKRLQRTLAVNALYEKYTYTDQPRESSFLFYPNASFSWIKTEDPLFSERGYNLNLKGMAGSKAVLSKTNFAQVAVDLKAATKFKPTRTRFYLHASQGYTAIKDINDLPLSLSFLLGGTENLKAYGFNSIGPGKNMTFASAEIQQETFKNWYLIGFHDIGNAYNNTPINFLRDVGAGLMWVSPVGPIKAGVAQAVDKNYKRIPNSKLKFFLKMGPDL